MRILNIFKRKNKIATGPTTGNRSNLSLKRSINDINAKLETIDLDNINQQFNTINNDYNQLNTKVTTNTNNINRNFTNINNLTNTVNTNYNNSAKLNNHNDFQLRNYFHNLVSFRDGDNEKIWFDKDNGAMRTLKTSASQFTLDSEFVSKQFVKSTYNSIFTTHSLSFSNLNVGGGGNYSTTILVSEYFPLNVYVSSSYGNKLKMNYYTTTIANKEYWGVSLFNEGTSVISSIICNFVFIKRSLS